MHKKIVLTVFVTGFLMINSFAQDIKEDIRRQAQDPKTTERAAKADASLHDNSIMPDSLKAPAKDVPVQKKKNRFSGGKTCGKASRKRSR